MQQYLSPMLRLGTLLAAMAVLMLGRTTASADSPVIHRDGHQTTAIAGLGQGWYLIAQWEGDRGDILRTNPDGSLWEQVGSPCATIKFAFATGDDYTQWPFIGQGTGLFEIQVTCYLSADGKWLIWDGEVVNIKCVAELETDNGDAGQLNFTEIIRDGELFLYILRDPFGDNFNMHKP